MATDNILRTYGDTSVVTDVLDMVENLSAVEDGLLSTLGKGTARAPLHQWQVDALDGIATTAFEVATFSAGAATGPSRSVNLTQFMLVDIGVSDREKAASHYGLSDMVAYQKAKAIKDLTNLMESTILRSSMVSGASGVAQQMAGVINCISSNVTAQTSGTVFNQSILDGLLANSWNNGNGEQVTDLYVGANMKRRISSFSGRTGTSFNIDASAKSLVTTTDGYLSDFGNLKVHLHRYMQKSYASTTDATARVLGINRNKFKVAWLIAPRTEEFGRRGSSFDIRASADCTVESLNEKTAFFASGYLNAG